MPVPSRKPPFRFSFSFLLTIIMLALLLYRMVSGMVPTTQDLPYSEFKKHLTEGQIASVLVSATSISGKLRDGTAFTTVRVEDPELTQTLEAQKVEIRGRAESSGGGILGFLLTWILPMGVMVGLWYWLMGRNKGGAGSMGSVFSFGKSKARVIQGEQTGVTFKDVGGAGEAVTDLKEVTEFLKNPVHFQRLGGKMPKGVLLVGPPGTGKTLLARATAGEAGVQFFNLSGAEFVEMFVGVGASRVRDLFVQAKKSAPSIIFIDEIDAIGGRRAGAGAIGVHEEREQTLNQLLAEMDGFETARGVIVMAATNRPEILDPALLRPGRFDRQIMVELPDRQGRLEILTIHVRLVTLGKDVNLEAVAQMTPGFSGADLANLVNEAALLASRHGKEAVDQADFDEAFERVVAGSERRTRTITANEKKVIAIHEAGHALIASLTPEADKVHKVTIVPRGRALGYTMQLPTHDRYVLGERELETRLTILVGGRVAETLVFGESSTGAADDLAQATDLARRMVTEFGMSTVLGPVRLAGDMQANFLSQQFGLDARVSPETATLVDIETRRILEGAVDEASSILKNHRLALDSLADLLCEHETVDGAQIDVILSQEKKQEEGEVFPGSAPNGHKPFQTVAGIKNDERPKVNVEPDDLLRWEYEGGQIANRLNEEDASALQGYSIKLERSPENAGV
ncbi:MAG TPA: ATP-dependent zinc metalloprotease FtsH [Anaerolineales bacterium]|nr:ATP-dependent zinc metalloprotease FtsH [Anaerolineales bacterium]